MGNKQVMGEENYRTSQSHPHQVDFLPGEYLPSELSSLGMMMCPGRNKKNHRRNLQQDLERIRDDFNGQTIVTLVRNEELESMKISDYLTKIQTEEFNMRSIHFPIKDKSLPDDKEEFCKLIDQIIRELVSGRRVIVHCNGGKGRAATVCTAVLLALKINKLKCPKYVSDSSNAMSIVRATRGSGTLQNPIQIIWLKTKFLRYYEREHKFES